MRPGASGGKIENTQPLDENNHELHFHYDRDDRMRRAGSALGRVDNRPWHRRNKGTLILVLDISLVVVIFIIYNVFLKPNLSVEEYDGQRYELRAVEFDSEILVTLRIEAMRDFPSGSTGLIEAAVFSGEEGAALQTIQEILPDEKGEDSIMRFRLGPEFTILSDDNVIVKIRVLAEEDSLDWDVQLTTGITSE